MCVILGENGDGEAGGAREKWRAKSKDGVLMAGRQEAATRVVRSDSSCQRASKKCGGEIDGHRPRGLVLYRRRKGGCSKAGSIKA